MTLHTNNKEKRKEYYKKNREKVLAYQRLYRLNNKEAVKISRQKTYLKHKDKINAYKKQWYLKNFERIKEKKKIYNIQNAEKLALAKKKYALEHKDEIKEYRKQYYKENADLIRNRSKEYRKKNEIVIKQRKKDFYANPLNKIKKNANINLRYAKDLNFRISQNCRGYLKTIFRKYKHKKSATFRELLGCSIDHLKIHLQQQFKKGMNWNNHSYRGWHIDHIKPISSFNLECPLQQRACFHYSNLQPLWAKENLSKGAKW